MAVRCSEASSLVDDLVLNGPAGRLPHRAAVSSGAQTPQEHLRVDVFFGKSFHTSGLLAVGFASHSHLLIVTVVTGDFGASLITQELRLCFSESSSLHLIVVFHFLPCLFGFPFHFTEPEIIIPAAVFCIFQLPLFF